MALKNGQLARFLGAAINQHLSGVELKHHWTEEKGSNLLMSIQLQKPDYVVIYVSDMQRSTAFYRDNLGLPLRFTSPGWTEFDTGSVTIALHRSSAGSSSAPTPRPPAGSVQLAFNVDDLQATYEALREQGIEFSMPPQQQASGITLAILHDPDGLGISLQQR